MRFTYNDTFLTKDKSEDEITNIENEAIREVNLQSTTNDFYFEKLVTCLVYMELCKEQFEDESVRKKYDVYKDEFKKYSLLSSTQTPPHNAQIYRG